jgi:uncharacterized membrane protein YqiK
MPATKTAPTTTPKVNLDEARKEGQALMQAIHPEVQELTVRTDDDYLVADAILGRIKKARKTWTDRMEKVIRPIRQGLDELYALNRDVDKPLADLEEGVKGKMKAFKLEEARLLREADERKRQEEDRLRREAEEAQRKAEAAKTPQLRGRLEAQATRLVAQAEVVSQQDTPEPIRGTSSTTRPQKRVRIKDLVHFLQGIVDGYVPEDCVNNPRVLDAMQPTLNNYFKDDPVGMEAWPGVEVYDDVQIVGR